MLTGRIPVLDGFRANAILMVMAAHLFGYSMLERQWPVVPSIVARVTAPGWLGVDLFFVLSGLLITSILLKKRSDAHFLRDFYARRIRRILPLYLIMLAVMVLVFGASWKFVLICLFTGANLLPVFGVAGPAPASLFWSLAVEEHFYFLWPITIRHLKRTNLAMICAAVIVVEPSLRYVCSMHGIDTYEYSWFRFDGLAMGAFLAVYLSSRFASPACSKWLVVSCAMVFVAGILFLIMAHAISNAGNKPAGTLRSTIAQFGFSGLMLAALEFPGKWVAPLCSRFARLTANLSYCLYLIHLSVAQIYDRYFTHHTFAAVVSRAAIVTAVSYGLAALSYHFLEQPLLRHKTVK